MEEALTELGPFGVALALLGAIVPIMVGLLQFGISTGRRQRVKFLADEAARTNLQEDRQTAILVSMRLDEISRVVAARAIPRTQLLIVLPYTVGGSILISYEIGNLLWVGDAEDIRLIPVLAPPGLAVTLAAIYNLYSIIRLREYVRGNFRGTVEALHRPVHFTHHRDRAMLIGACGALVVWIFFIVGISGVGASQENRVSVGPAEAAPVWIVLIGIFILLALIWALVHYDSGEPEDFFSREFFADARLIRRWRHSDDET